MESRYCFNCGKLNPGIHTCYDVFATGNPVGTQKVYAANARLERIEQQAAEIERLEAAIEKADVMALRAKMTAHLIDADNLTTQTNQKQLLESIAKYKAAAAQKGGSDGTT